jgi:uncharacterized protein (TIGR02284 family)
MASEAARLQSLTQTAVDSVKGYESAAQVAKSPALKQTLTQAASRRQQVVDQLNQEIVRLGGQAQTSGSALGGAHRVWTQISDAFGSGDEKAAERVQEGEDYLEEQFRDALDDSDFSPQTREVVSRAHGDITQGERLANQLADQYDQ